MTDRTAAILKVTLDLAQEVGYAKLSIEGIAARAGVGKHTVYRRWPSKGALFLDALLSSIEEDLSYPDTGDVVADLRTQMLSATNVLARPPYNTLYAALVGEAQHDPAIAKTLHERFIEPQARRTIDRLCSAQEKGQLPPDLDLEMALTVLYGPLYFIFLLTPETLSADHVNRLLDTVLTIGFRVTGS
ncbi:TetR/AcrR family transcriptional regulator [Nocardia crassostreae]|uniref:TetR/AcrR family transcriptional regulator n=1 Tax=Nocardia crassostreae TaxID=53428 RepID=UPI001C3FE678|nr:TetR/AcrR family transcriptional regulator [Nocardia crassostreae]